jgi:hypothetical protein
MISYPLAPYAFERIEYELVAYWVVEEERSN